MVDPFLSLPRFVLTMQGLRICRRTISGLWGIDWQKRFVLTIWAPMIF